MTSLLAHVRLFTSYHVSSDSLKYFPLSMNELQVRRSMRWCRRVQRIARELLGRWHAMQGWEMLSVLGVRVLGCVVSSL